MKEFTSELMRRTLQFEHYLELMVKRRREVDRDAYLIFAEQPPDCEVEIKQFKAKREKQIPANVGASVLFPGDPRDVEVNQDLGEREKSNRFVQFSFWEKFVVCDLPDTTVTRFEGRKIIRDCPGFFYVREQPDYPHYRQDVPDFDPLQKQYIINDMESAAADTTRIFFQTWCFPIETPLYVTGSTFHSIHSWECGVPIS